MTGSAPEPARARAAAFVAARDLLLDARVERDRAVAEFRWPDPYRFNWALDYFDAVLAADHPDREALRLVAEDGSRTVLTFAELADRSSRLAGWLERHGVERRTRVLLVLGNQIELWESMLACIKLGAVLIPATTLLSRADLANRVERGRVRAVICAADVARSFDEVPCELAVAVADPPPGWVAYPAPAGRGEAFRPSRLTLPDEPLLLYFTSGTTSRPKLVEHTHASYPVGHLSTMYWIGLQPGDVHMNVSSPGWAKHAWSCVFAPWNAGASVLQHNWARFEAPRLLDLLAAERVTTFCAPPTVWRMLVQEDLGSWQLSLREVVAAGEPLNPEVIEQVKHAWGLTVRDGYGQTETTAQIGNPPGQQLKPGSMGRPLPGYRVVLADPLTGQRREEAGAEGEICLDLADRPLGLMTGYQDDPELEAQAMAVGLYHTGDVATIDAEGFITYVGRTDDVFKASDYRISPFELESVLIEHPAVAEAAVVPAPDALRLAVPKAYVTLAAGHEPSPELAGDILAFARSHLAPYQRVRRIEFAELPKTISGKIRRVDLRQAEAERGDIRADGEYREEDFPS